jgi:uncharacterized protein (TIGR00369 family)
VADQAPADVSDAARTRTVSWGDPAIAMRAAPNQSGLELLRAILFGKIPAPPMAALIGLEPVSAESGHVVFAMTPGEHLYNPLGVVHGGALATLLDTALGCAVLSVLPKGRSYTTVELHINFVAPVTVSTGRVVCDAVVLHAGGRMSTAEAKVRDANGKLYAHATTTCFVFPVPSSRTEP